MNTQTRERQKSLDEEPLGRFWEFQKCPGHFYYLQSLILAAKLLCRLSHTFQQRFEDFKQSILVLQLWAEGDAVCLFMDPCQCWITGFQNRFVLQKVEGRRALKAASSWVTMVPWNTEQKGMNIKRNIEERTSSEVYTVQYLRIKTWMGGFQVNFCVENTDRNSKQVGLHNDYSLEQWLTTVWSSG